jgi:flavin reductase (DIM6/NTAB) family NADH-FMN oxidoreductase RutF
MDTRIAPVELGKAYRLINHGPTVLVSARHDGVDDVMAAAWACGLEASPSKLTVVLDKSSMTRGLLERSSRFVVQVPTVRQAGLTHAVGTRSLRDDAGKLARCGVELFQIEGGGGPFVKGCSAWLSCKVIHEPRNQDTYDLFIGEVVGAWADTRVFRNGHWDFENADPELRSIHYIAGGHFYAIGDPVIVRPDGKA